MLFTGLVGSFGFILKGKAMKWSEIKVGEEYCLPGSTEITVRQQDSILNFEVHPVRRICDLIVGDMFRFINRDDAECTEIQKDSAMDLILQKGNYQRHDIVGGEGRRWRIMGDPKVAVVSFARERHSEDTTMGRMFALNMEKESLACRIYMNAKTENEEKKMQDTPPIITADFLRKHIADEGCKEPDRFEKDFPRGLPLTHENVVHASEIGHDIRAFFRALGIDYSSGAYIKASIPKVRELQKQVTFEDIELTAAFKHGGDVYIKRSKFNVINLAGWYNAIRAEDGYFIWLNPKEPVTPVKIRIEVEEV